MSRYLTTLPFAGFYYSVHSYALDHEVEFLCEDDNGRLVCNTLHDQLYCEVEWQRVHEAYAKSYCETFADWLGITLTFDALESPRFYNFETDRIFAYIDEESLQRVLKGVSTDRLRQRIRQRFTSRDGFISHYPNDLSDWPETVYDWDHNQIGTLLELYAQIEAGTDDFGESGLMEDATCNGDLHNWITNNLTPKGERLLKVADWLRERRSFTMADLIAERRAENRPFNNTPLGAWGLN